MGLFREYECTNGISWLSSTDHRHFRLFLEDQSTTRREATEFSVG